MDRTDRFNSLNKLSIEKRLLKVFRKTTILLSMTGVIACVAMGIVSYQYSYALKHYGFAQGDIGKAMIVIAEMRSETRAAIGYDDDTLIATAKNVLSLMSLGAKQGESLILTADGPDEKLAMGYLSGILRTIL